MLGVGGKSLATGYFRVAALKREQGLPPQWMLLDPKQIHQRTLLSQLAKLVMFL